MPQEGAAILSQVEGLLEQFLALPYETPVKEQAQAWLEEVQAGMEALRSEEGGELPEEEVGLEGAGELPIEGETAPSPEPPVPPEGPPPPAEKPKSFAEGRRAAMDNVKQTGSYDRPGAKSERKQPDTEEDRKRRKKVAARK